MSYKRKLIAGITGITIVFASFSSVFAAESTNSDLAFKQEKMSSVKDLDSLFHKKSYKPTQKDYQKSAEYKNRLVEPDKLGPKGKGEPPHLPNGWELGDSFGNPTGTNNISFSNFDHGDIIVVHDGNVAWGYYRHAALFDADYWNGNLSDYCFWEANVSPTSDVHRAPASKFQGYDEAVGLWVPNTSSSERYDTTVYAAAQSGEPYSTLYGVYDDTHWYCSKLVFRAYYVETGNRIDLRYSSNSFVYPDDLYQDPETRVFATGY